MSSATCTPSRSLSAWATWAILPTSVWMSTYALSIRSGLLAGRSRHPCLTGGPWRGMLHKTGQPADRQGRPAAARSTAAGILTAAAVVLGEKVLMDLARVVLDVGVERADL